MMHHYRQADIEFYMIHGRFVVFRALGRLRNLEFCGGICF